MIPGKYTRRRIKCAKALEKIMRMRYNIYAYIRGRKGFDGDFAVR